MIRAFLKKTQLHRTMMVLLGSNDDCPDNGCSGLESEGSVKCGDKLVQKEQKDAKRGQPADS